MNTRLLPKPKVVAILLTTAQATNAGQFETLLYPGSTTTVAADIDGGDVVGYWDDAQGKRNGFIDDRGTATWTTVNHPDSASPGEAQKPNSYQYQ